MPPTPASAEYVRLISQYQGALYAYVLTLHPDRAQAEDIVQETNVVLWEKSGVFAAGTNFKAWAFRIAYLQTLAFLKRAKRRSWLEYAPDLLETLAEEARLEDFDERLGALKQCLGALPAADTGMLRAHYENEEPLAQIAATLGRTENALKQALFRLRRALRQCIERRLAAEL